MKKRILSIIVSLVILMSFVNVDVYADEQPVEDEQITEYSVNLIYNNQNIPKESYQTIDNYNAYYDLLSGNLKNDIIFGGFQEGQYNRNQFDAFYNSINYIGNNEYLDFNELTFKAITIDSNVIPFNDCKYFISLSSDTSNTYITFYLMYSPSQSPIYISGGQIGSDNMFYVSSHRYYMIANLIDGIPYASYSEVNSGGVEITRDTDVSVAPAPNGVLTFYNYYNFGAIILSSDPVYYQWNGQNDTANNDLYNMGYSSPYYIYWHLLQNDDTTGFLTDRRVYVGDTSDEDGVIRDEIDYTLYDGKLGFNGFHPQSSINGRSNGTDWRCNPFTYIKYSLNNYTRLKPPEEVLIKFDTKCYVKYKTSLGYYQSWVWNSSIDYPVSDAPDELFLNYIIFSDENAKYNANWTEDNGIAGNSEIFYNSQDYLNVINFYYIRQLKFSDDDMIYLPGSDDYLTEPQKVLIKTIWGKDGTLPNVFIDMQIYYDTTAYLYDTATGETSGKTNFKFDLILGNTSFDDGAIYDDDEDFSDFITDHDFDNDDKPIIYVPTEPIVVNPGQYYGDDSAHASIGDITIGSTVAELIVDMSEEEWLQHSPTFNNMMEAVKQGYLDTAEDSGSMLDLIRSTYDIFPPEVWKYLLTAIGVISSLAIIRYIRRG